MTFRSGARRATRSRASKLAYLVGVVDGATIDRPDLRDAMLLLMASGNRARVREVARILDVSESTLRRRYVSLRLKIQTLVIDGDSRRVRRKTAHFRNG